MKSSSIDGKIIDMLGWTFSNIFEHKTFSRKDWYQGGDRRAVRV